MRIIRVLAVLIYTISFINNSYSQAGAAIPSLSLNPSPRLNALGMVGAVFPNDDPLGFYYNPAQLGYISQTENLALQVYPSNALWLPHLFSDTYRNTSFNIGYNFEKMLNGLKLSAGFGYIHSKINYLGNSAYTSLFQNYDEFSTYGFGVGLDYYIQINLGLSYKSITSVLPNYASDVMGTNSEANASAMDYGILMNVPVLKLIEPGYEFNVFQDVNALPYFNVSLGYSYLNVGEKVWYLDKAQADPLPRTARAGYTLSAGIDLKLKNTSIKAFGYDFIAEASDFLIKVDPETFSTSYLGLGGNIVFGRNLIELKGDDNVTVHKGHNFSLFETVDFMIGRFDGSGYDHIKTSGIGVRAKGILTLLKAYTSNRTFQFIADHFDIQYYSAKLFTNDIRETSLDGISIVFGGYEF